MTLNLSVFFSHFTRCDFSIWEVYYIPLMNETSIEVFPGEKCFVYLIDLCPRRYTVYFGLACQEFHLSQTYHEGLHKLQTKEYKRASELLESVLKDPLIANAQVRPSKKYFYRW